MDTLPEELLLQIFGIVSECGVAGNSQAQWTRNLHSLSLVSRTFNRVATPLLYKRIQCPYWRRDNFWGQINSTLQQNPARAQDIKSIETPRYQYGYSNRAPNSVGRRIPLPMVPKLHNQDLDEYEHRSYDGDNILLAFLVLQTTNLEILQVLNLGARYEYRELRLPLVVEEMNHAIYDDLNAGLTPRWGELHTLSLALDNWTCFPNDTLLPFLHLPRLRSLILRGWGVDSAVGGPRIVSDSPRRLPWVGAEWPSRTSSIQELSLECQDSKKSAVSILHGKYIGQIIVPPNLHTMLTLPLEQVTKLIGACKALKLLEIRIRMIMEWAFCDALLGHADTLETLSIVSPLWYGAGGLYDEPGRLKSPTSFHYLKNLQVPYEILTGRHFSQYVPQDIAPLLPQSLERLVLVIWEQTAGSRPMRLEGFIEPISNGIRNAVLADSLLHLQAVELRLIQKERLLLPSFDVADTRTLLKARNVNLDISLVCVDLKETEIPTRDMMRAWRQRCPASVGWCRRHRVFKASTCARPHLPDLRAMRGHSLADWSPYHPVVMPWDYENEDESAIESIYDW